MNARLSSLFAVLVVFGLLDVFRNKDFSAARGMGDSQRANYEDRTR